MLEHSVIGRTGQAGKAVIALGGLILGGAIALLPIVGEAVSTRAALVKFGAALFSLGCFFYGCRAIRCPACGTRWVWDAVSGRAASAWLASLLRTPNCPSCGHPDRRRPPTAVPVGGHGGKR